MGIPGNIQMVDLHRQYLQVKEELDAYHIARQDNASRYNQLLSGVPEIQTPFRAAFSTHVFHQCTLRVEPEFK